MVGHSNVTNTSSDDVRSVVLHVIAKLYAWFEVTWFSKPKTPKLKP
jgi:hypothetical protein